MKKQYNILISERKPVPRSKRMREAGQSASSAAVLVSGTTSGGTQGDGHKHTNLADLERIGFDKEDSEYLTVRVGSIDEETGEPIISYEKVKAGYADRAGVAHDLDEDSPVNNKYVRKDRDDTVNGLITFVKGFVSNAVSVFKQGMKFGNYVTGMIGGSGGAITVDEVTGKTVLEVDKVLAREELIVPKITFNCIDVISGDKANTFAFGTIKSVDRENFVAELDLLDDQIGTLHTSDICRGVFHNLEGGNHEEDSYDTNGYLNYAGFATAYFTPTNIIENKPGIMKFSYSLQAGTSVHPMPGMNFFAYGNFLDKSRQSITYENRYYTRRLKNVNTWVINPTRNIAMQDGLLEGLTIGSMVMHGSGTYMENCYFTGVQIQFTPEQKDEIKGEDAYSVNLSTYESVIVVDDENNLIGGLIDERFVTSGEEYVTSGDDNVTATLARLKTRIQAFRGSKEMYYSDEYHEDAYMVILNPVGCKAIVDNGLVVITEISDYDNCYVDIAVNCEGNCVFDKSYKITAVKNGTSVLYADINNEMSSVSCDASGNVLFGLPVQTSVTMWYGNNELAVDKIELSLPEGVTGISDKGNVTITGIDKSALSNLNIGITAYATYAGIQYHKQLTLVVNKIVPGENGQNAIIYNLNPSVNAIKIDKAGNYDVSSISCGLIKTDGASSISSSLPQGYVIKYTIDGGNAQTYTLGNNIDATKIEKKILFQILKGSTLIDQETIYVIADGHDGEPGNDGESSIYADLDNVITSVACSSAGEVLFGLPVSTGVNMWHGTEKLSLDAITVSVPTGVVYTVVSNVVKVTSIAASVSDIINLTITVKATAKGIQYTRELVFTINKVKQGEDGESPVLYDLKPSVSSVKVDKNNKYNPETISCKVSRTIATTTETLSVLPAGFSLYYTRDNSQTLIPYSYGTSLSLSGFNTSISFYLKHGEVIIDMETILIIKDGIDGGDGKDGGHTELRYKYAFGKPVAPTGINPRDWALSPDKEDIIPSFSGDFVKKGEYYVSPAPTSQSATYKQRVSFVTNKDNQVMYLEIDVSSETYDHGIVCALDTSYSTSAETLWNKGGLEKTIVEIVIPSAGSHFVDVVYVKDGSVDKYEDMFKFRILDPQICWLSTAVIEDDNPIIWSEPIIFPTDTPINEQIYLLARSELAVDMPASDQYVSEYIGDAPDYDNTRSYVTGNIVKYNNVYKVAMKAVTGIEPTGNEYWEDVEWWSDNPRGVSEVYPYEYTCERKFIQGRWEVYANYRLFMHYAKDGESAYQLIPSVTQIMRTMTGSYEPSSFSVSHKDGKGNPVEAYVAVWGSQNGEEWTLVGSIVKISFRTINVAQYPYKYFVIRTYATALATWSSEYLLSASVNVIKDGEKGNSGAIPVYCGFYESDVEYTYTDTTRDIINYEIDGGVFTFQVKVHGATVTNPPTSSVGDANWETANKFKFVAMDTALIDGANIAGFMYKFLKMISRLGTLDNAEIDIKDVPASRIADFKPNLSMDGVTGKITCINADITGVINATEGYLGALKISGNRLSSEDLNSGIIIGSGKEGETGSGRFLRLGGGVNSSLIGIRLDRQNPLVNGHSGMSIESYGSKNVCLRLLANAGSKFAQDSVGPHRFYQREGEVWDSPGVLWSGRISANGTIENYWGNGCAVTSVYHGSKGLYALNHDIGHTNYFVQATAVHGEWSIAAITTKTRDQCTVMTFHKDGNYGDSAVEVTIIGRNRYKEY